MSFSLAQAAIAELVEKAEAQERLRSRMEHVSLTAHDLRNPLTAAKLNAQILARGGDRSPEQVALLGARILESIERMDQMIHDFLDEASNDATGRSSSAVARDDSAACLTDAEAVIRETINGFSTVHSDRFICLIDEGLQGAWNREGLRRSIENLLTNALKYGEGNSPITIRLKRVENRARIAVHNFGAPIPESRRHFLVSVHNRISRSKKGWGLGLKLIKQFAREHGGHLVLESSAGEGTTFILDLPLSGPGTRPGLTRAPRPKAEESKSDGLT